MAEVNLGAGLGDVIAQTGNGLVLRTKPGAPGIGEIKSFNHDVYIAWKTFGGIETSEIIRNSRYHNIISSSGSKYLELFEDEPTLENFLAFSLYLLC
jgi:pantoate kinase